MEQIRNRQTDGKEKPYEHGGTENAVGKNKKADKTISHNPTLDRKVKRGYRFYCTVIVAMSFVFANAIPVFAASDPIAVVNNLSDFIFGLIRAVGLILLGWGIVQVGLSLQSHDPSQRSNGFLTLAGGIVNTFAKEILTLITG